MNISPDQARELLDVATPGPWGRTGMGALTDTDGKVIVNGPDGNLDDSDANLAAAAPELAQTIAGMRREYTFQTRPRGLPWREWTTQEDWFDNRDAAYSAAVNIQDAGSFNCRLVRRLVGPVEDAE